MFSPHHFPPSVKSHKGSPLYTDLRLTNLSEAKRSQPSWTIEEYKRNSGEKGKLAALDLQVSAKPFPHIYIYIVHIHVYIHTSYIQYIYVMKIEWLDGKVQPQKVKALQHIYSNRSDKQFDSD